MCQNQKQETLLLQFRETIEDLLPTLEGFRQSDWYLWKFLEEHRFNMKASAEALKSATKWKTEMKLHLLHGEEKCEMFRRFPYENDGIDEDGHPILMVPFGRWKIREAVENGEREVFLRHAIEMTEINQARLKNALEASNGAVNSVIIIFDLKGYSIRQLMHRQTISTLSEWTKRSEQLYPQQLQTFFVINANRIMPILFSLLKPFMSHNTVSRVKIFDSDSEQWRRVLFEHISPDQFTSEYGGTKNLNDSTI